MLKERATSIDKKKGSLLLDVGNVCKNQVSNASVSSSLLGSRTTRLELTRTMLGRAQDILCLGV